VPLFEEYGVDRVIDGPIILVDARNRIYLPVIMYNKERTSDERELFETGG